VADCSIALDIRYSEINTANTVSPLLQLSRASGLGRRVRVIDSHTEGEPTRVVFDGVPDLGDGSVQDRLARLVSDHDAWRRATIAGPRGSEGTVAALLLPARDLTTLAQVLYYNTQGPLPMCVHATIGVVETMRRYGNLGATPQHLETPAGIVTVRAMDDGRVEVENVPSSRVRRELVVPTSHGPLVGDIAWGGNWFFVARDPKDRIRPEHIERLQRMSGEVLEHLAVRGICGADGAAIDHVYLIGSPDRADAQWRSFVLCPDGNYDRSPCGTGTSAALACLIDAGEVACDQDVLVQSVTGSTFEARAVRSLGGGVRPTIRGRAYITAESTLVFDENDPTGWPA